MRTNVDLDDTLMEEAFRLTGVRTKKRLLHLALEELIRVRRKRNLAELSGAIRFADGFEHKELRRVRAVDSGHVDLG